MSTLNGTRILLAAACVVALAGCTRRATPDPRSDCVPSKSDSVLKAMSDRLAGAQQLSFTAHRQMDPQLIESPNQIGTATIEAQIARPDRVKAVAKGGGDERRLYIAKEGSVIFSPLNGFYARFNGYATIEESIDAISEDLDIHVPMQDFVGSNPYRDFQASSAAITHEGVDTINGVSCDHLKGTRADLEWHLWIAQSDQLPRRCTITIAALKGRDHWQADFSKWNLNPKFAAGALAFTPPKGATQIDILVNK